MREGINGEFTAAKSDRHQARSAGNDVARDTPLCLVAVRDVYSVTRTPSDRRAQGYVERRYVAAPSLSLANVSRTSVRYSIWVWNMTGSRNVEMDVVGSLPTYSGDIFRIGDNPRVKFESFKQGQKAGDIYTNWHGFIEIFASDDIYPRGWIDYTRKASEELYDQSWSRPMTFDPVTDLRPEIAWPIVESTATQQFRAAPGAADAAAMSDFAKLIAGAAQSVDDFMKKK